MKNKILTIAAGTILAAAVLISPTFALAKENGKGNGQDVKTAVHAQAKVKVEIAKTDNDNDGDEGIATTTGNPSACLKAFGHFFAPGWIQNNGALSISDACHFPFGIGKLM